MPQYYLAKVRITNGQEIQTNKYLVDAVSLTDTEVRVIGSLTNTGEAFDEIDVFDAKREAVEEVLNLSTYAEPVWYKAIVEVEDIDPDNQQAKTMKKNFYIASTSIFAAIHDLGDSLKNWMVEWTVKSIAEANITDVFPFDPEEKFTNLPERLKKSASRVIQTEAFSYQPKPEKVF